MPHLVVTVDGIVKYEGDVPEQFLPTQPAQFPAALGVNKPDGPPTPLMRLGGLTASIELFRRLAVEGLHATVNVHTHSPGKATIDVDMPLPTGV